MAEVNKRDTPLLLERPIKDLINQRKEVGWRRIYLFAFTGATPSVEELRQPLSYSRFALWKDATAVAAISTLNIG